MALAEIDRKVLTWLRALGSEPDYTYQTNIRSYEHTARKASEVLNIPPDTIRDRLLALEQDGFVEIVRRSGYSSIYYARITEEGRHELRQPPKDEGGSTMIFVSCGQTTDEERDLGATIADIINQQTPARAYYAENQATFEGVSSHILDSLSRCVGFVGIMHYRGLVTEPNQTSYERASVWIEQEIAIAAYRIHTLKETIPVQLYIQRDIKREGLRDKVMLNPTTFDSNEEVIEHFRSIVKGRFGS
jgi:DNA-binding transcriptional ArsR family regulator